MHKGKVFFCVAVMSGSLVVACGSKSKSTKSSSGGQATNLSDLKLSTALSLVLPESLQKAARAEEGQANLRLMDSYKSSEACEAIQMIDEQLDDVRSNGAFLCHMEVEKLELGKKYNVKFTNIPDGGEESEAQIWADNSDPSDLKVYYCVNKKLAMKFNINGLAGPGLIKGKSLMNWVSQESDGANFTFSASTEYDLTVAGTKVLKSSSKSTSTQSNLSYIYLVNSDIKLVDSGVSSLLVSKGGSSTFASDGVAHPYDEQLAVLFNGQVGQALKKDGSNAITRATFNSEGYKLNSSDATSDVIVDQSKLPTKLSDSFSPEALEGWDCNTTESVTVDLAAQDKKAAHDACDVEWPEFDQCNNSSIFQPGDSNN